MLLISDLLENSEELIGEANRLQALNADWMQLSPEPGKWSVLQILDHLNITFDAYNPIIIKAIESEKRISGSNGQINLTWFGKLFINFVGPDSKKKLPAPKQFKPHMDVSLNKEEVFEQFLFNQRILQEEMIQSKSISLNGKKIASPVSKLIRFRLGELFTLILRHEQRHFLSLALVEERFKEVSA